MEFSARDLLWTKNVTRDHGQAWAYDEHKLGDTFFLNFSLGHHSMGIASARKAKANQLVLLVQSIYDRRLGRPGTYLSHIVATVDEDLEFDDSGSHPVKRLVTVVARDEEMKPKPTFLDFREPNRGWTCDLNLIKPKKDSGLLFTLQQKQDLFWEMFQCKDIGIKHVIAQAISPDLDPITGAMEGEEKYLFKRHKYYERDPQLIADKKKEAVRMGMLFCQICSFDFVLAYGSHGNGFIECHHIFPIAGNGKRFNRPQDLALVCGNCHRMLHRRNSSGEYYSVEGLRELLIQQGSNL